MERTLHKVTIEVDEKLWRSFKSLAIERGETVQLLLGSVVEREARAAERREAQRLGRSRAAKRAMEKALREIREHEGPG